MDIGRPVSTGGFQSERRSAERDSERVKGQKSTTSVVAVDVS